MAPVAGDTVRPLIETSRDEIEAICKVVGQGVANRSSQISISPLLATGCAMKSFLGLHPYLMPAWSTPLARTITLLEEEDQWMQR